MTEKLFEEDRYIIKNSRVYDTYKKLPITPKLTNHECEVIIAHLNFHKEIITTKGKQLRYVHNEYDKIKKENGELKQALREQLEYNGNAYCIKILDKIFDLKYDEWQRKMNETHTYDYIDWEKVLKDKGDV